MPNLNRNPLIVLAVLTSAACGPADSSDDIDGSGGTSGSGTEAGSSGSGGTSGSSGTGSGGVNASGGTPNGTGGSTSNGGANSAGTTVNAGGSGNAGGATAGNSGTGNAGTSGGGTAGSAMAGNGGADSAGTSGSGSGAAGAGMAGAAPTSGCGAAEFPPAAKQSLMVDGTDVPREFIVTLPDDYDPAEVYRLVFGFHGLTGTAEQIAGNGFAGGYYGLASRIGSSTVLVSPQGLAPDDEPTQYGWPNTGGRDIAFVRAMIEWLGSNYCIDQARIFSVGMSYGGMMSNTIGCELSDVFRGIAPIAGALFGRGCMGSPIAVWMSHGTADSTVTFEQGEAARDIFLETNQCDTSLEPTPVEPEGCVSYQGCAAGFPVIWCPHDGGHTVPSFTGQAVADFFSSF